MFTIITVIETDTHLLTNVSKFWGGQVKNWPGQVEFYIEHIDGLMQDCSNSTANALELLQSCTKPLI